MNLHGKPSARRTSVAVLIGITLFLAACSEDRTLPSYARLNRSSAVDFVCVEAGTPVQLATCRERSAADLKLYALVAQSTRGEIATIDLATRELLDTRADIPGYTFVPAGEGPVSVVVSRAAEGPAAFTYVANFGSRDVYVFDTKALVPPALSSAPLQVVPLSVMGADGGAVPAAPTQMLFDASPTGDALLVAVPNRGQILRLPIQRCAEDQAACHTGWIDTAGIGTISLQGSTTRPAANVPPSSGDQRYEELCSYPRPTPPAAAPIPLVAAELTAMPRPRAMVVDDSCREGELECKRRLLVADDALPLIHAIDLTAFGAGDASAALLDPISVGVPTRALAVTPRVPIALGSEIETQYIYAIDATDGSVLVIEGSQVLNVNSYPDPRPDRIELPNTEGRGAAAAQTLAVLTPGFDPALPSSTQYLIRATSEMAPEATTLDAFCPQPDRTEQDPALLRGVFVAVALSDGLVRLIDVHDMTLRTPDGSSDQACRQCALMPAASDPTTGMMLQAQPYQVPLLARHHPRLTFNPQSLGTAPTLLPSATTAAFLSGGQQYSVREDGTSGSPDAPNLDCLQCGALRRVLPRVDTSSGTTSQICPDAALLCALDDPWSALDEPWSATYEGAIPNATGGDAVFVKPGRLNGAPELHANLDFCSAGVLGDEDIAPVYADADCDSRVADIPPKGDQVTITSPLLNATDADCVAAHKALESDASLTLSFPIRRAYRDWLVISETAVAPPGAPEALLPVLSLEGVRRCTGGGPMSFMVRAREALTVEGLQQGFLHNVVANTAGRCEVNTSAPIRAKGRTRPGCTFDNGTIAFRMKPPSEDEGAAKAGTRFLLQVRSPSPRIAFDANSLGGFGEARVLPVQLRYLEVTRSLYMVDINERGLVPIPAGDQPFPTAIDATLTVN